MVCLASTASLDCANYSLGVIMAIVFSAKINGEPMDMSNPNNYYTGKSHRTILYYVLTLG